MTTVERSPALAPQGHSRVARVSIPIAWVQLSAVLLALAAAPLAKRVDPDFWWHLAAGDRIRDSGIPQTDPYSWTAAGKPWAAHEWLSEAIISAMQSAFGYAGNVVLFDIAAITALVAMYALARRLRAGSHVLLLLTLLSSATFILFLTPRPQVFSWLLFTVFLHMLVLHERRDSRVLAALLPLMLLWANLHLGFVYGLMLVGLWLVARVIDRLRGEPVTLWVPVALCLGCALPVFATPSGYDIFAYPFRYFEDRESLRFIAEWRSPLSFSVLLLPYYASVALVAFALVSTRRPSLYLILVTLAVGALTLTAVRNVPFLVLLLLPVAGPALTRAAQTTRPPVRMRLVVAAPAVIAMLVLITAIAVRLRGESGFGEPSDQGYPDRGAAWIAANAPGARLYNEYTWGGYLIYRLPEVPVFVDGRTDFYRSRILEDYIAVGRLDDGWQRVLDSYRVDTLLIRKNSRLAATLRGGDVWREAFVGSLESVFVRTD